MIAFFVSRNTTERHWIILSLYIMLQVSYRIHVVHNYISNYGCIRCNIYLHLAIQCYYGSKIRELHPWHLNIMKLQSKIMHPNILFSLSLRICKIVPRNSYHSSQNEYINCRFKNVICLFYIRNNFMKIF